MGSDRNRDALAAANEERQRLYLPEYMIACVPLTVAQFRYYVTAMHPRTAAEVKGGAHDYDPSPKDSLLLFLIPISHLILLLEFNQHGAEIVFVSPMPFTS
jgi:hypothetical protein